ncbi:hypothetical protein BH11VER1_BH11VER1_34440 [soil metagenome]
MSEVQFKKKFSLILADWGMMKYYPDGTEINDWKAASSLALDVAKKTLFILESSSRLSTEDASALMASYADLIKSLESPASIPDILFYVYDQTKHGENPDQNKNLVELMQRILMEICSPKPIYCQFLERTHRPSEFYQTYPEVKDMCRILGTPVVTAIENTVINVTSINPLTAFASSKLIELNVKKSLGCLPFTFAVVAEFDAWTTLKDKHFPA